MARIAIIGGGLMGHGLAQVFACADHDVRITDPSAEARDKILSRIADNLDDLGLDRGATARVQVCASLPETVAQAQWIFEAAPEDVSLKRRRRARPS